MASPHHSLPSPSISDVMSLLSTMKRENNEAMKDILTKLTRLEEDNRKLRQELQEIKSSQRQTIKVSSKKRNEPEDEDGSVHLNEHSNSNKKAKVSVASLPEVPACFDSLDDDCLGNVLDFVGKKCYTVFGLLNKRCHGMFCGLPKETYLFGYGPLHLIQQKKRIGIYNIGFSEGVFHHNRRDILDWMLTDESSNGCFYLGRLCCVAIGESRVDILREIFQRANERQLKKLRCYSSFDSCRTVARHGKLECMKLLRENECEWDDETWYWAKQNGHEHILQYMRDNGYPTEWQVDLENDESKSESESEIESESESEN